MNIVENNGSNKDEFPYILYIRGSPERIMQFCSHCYSNNTIELFNTDK